MIQQLAGAWSRRQRYQLPCRSSSSAAFVRGVVSRYQENRHAGWGCGFFRAFAVVLPLLV